MKQMKKKRKVIIIGGVAGGMSFANRYRRLNIDDEIIVFEKGPYVSFANCGLPYFLSGEINSRSRLLVAREEELVKKFNLIIRSNSEVTNINPQKKLITYFKDGQSFEEKYDKLVISTGAKPIQPNIDGINTIPHFVLRNIPHLDEIMKFIKDHSPKSVLIIGAGFIGLEVAENLIKKGVEVFVNNEIIKIENNKVYLKNGEQLIIDFIIASIGLLPDTELAAKAGLNLGIKGGIVVDEKYRTSDPHIYAVGDAVIVKNQ